ncbi:MAG TPA: hypothetical protein VK698_22515 [Kofleriaceae bacterium]|nr:hypothetical protein [Kofleriaceae bacterium]
MSRLALGFALAVLLLVASACESKQATGAAPVQPTAEPTTPTAVATAEQTEPPAAQTEPPADAAPADTAVGAAAPFGIDELAGQYGFGWSGGKKAKCQKLDEKLIEKLSGVEVMCRYRDPGEAFAEGAGSWSTCQVGMTEWVVFASKKICQEQLETMEANGP